MNSRDIFRPMTAFALCAVLLVIRTLLIRNVGEPWGEDAEIILSAISGGVSVFTPVFDTLLFASRSLVEVLLQIVGTYNLPLSIAVSSALLMTLIAAYPMRAGFEWLTPSPAVRLSLSLILALGPGTIEVVGSAICIAYLLTLLLLVLLLERPLGSPKLLIFVAGISVISTHTSIIAVPLLLARLWEQPRNRTLLLVLLLLIAGLVIPLTLSTLGAHRAAPIEFFLNMSADLARFILVTLFLAPFAGWGLLSTIGPADWSMAAAALIPAVVFVILLRRTSQPAALAALSLAAGVVVYVLAMLWGRAAFYNLNPSAAPLAVFGFMAESRHALYCAALPIFMWCLVTPWGSLGRTGVRVLQLAIVMQLLTVLQSWLHPAFTEKREWTECVSRIERLQSGEPLPMAHCSDIAPHYRSGSWGEILCGTEAGLALCRIERGLSTRPAFPIPVN